jgi:acyl-CoA synthetase (NDP forming)
MVVSHTASLAGSDDLVSALFERLGVARVDSLEALMEALKVLHVLGPLNGGRIGAMSTSGGDLTLLADAMGPSLTMPPLSEKVKQGLRATVHERVVAANPFDYQMFNWDDEDHMADKFTAFLSEDFDVSLCLLDYPREDLCDQSTWGGAERGFVRAAQQTGTKAAVLATFSDTMSESVAELIVGVARDAQFGPYLLVGGGGILVEMMKDSTSLLMPTARERVLQALAQLKCAPLFSGFRGAPPADLNAAVDVILAVAGMLENNPSSIIELDINPLMLLAEGRGVVAADALISLNAESRQ